MGGGLSSMPKDRSFGPTTHPHADADQTFVRMAKKEARVDLSGYNSNLSLAIGTFEVDEGFVKTTVKEALERLRSTKTKTKTKTKKIIWSHFEVEDGLSDGDVSLHKIRVISMLALLMNDSVDKCKISPKLKEASVSVQTSAWAYTPDATAVRPPAPARLFTTMGYPQTADEIASNGACNRIIVTAWRKGDDQCDGAIGIVLFMGTQG